MRRALLLSMAISVTTLNAQTPDSEPHGFDVVEATIPDLQTALRDGRVTSRELVLLYLARIAYYEDTVNAVMTVSRTALAEADALDRERAEGRDRGPLHGIPLALKDNIHTTSVPTTGGALAFENFTPPYEATLTKNLRDAGAIILAKTVLTELANWVAGAPSPMPGNYSALGGFGMNPYDPRPDPRRGFDDGRPALGTGGSSSGIGTATSFWAANVGTETSGSILSPSNQNMLVGIKPTVGRISRYGVIPITADQDTAGPMARTVTDAAILLGALESPSPDPNDPATTTCTPPPNRDYTAFLRREGLMGARIGIPRAFYYDAVTLPAETDSRGGLDSDRAALMAEAIEILKKEGAVIVDPADIPSIVDSDPKRNFLTWSSCAGIDERKGHDSECSIVLKYGMKRDFNAWLASLGPTAPVKTLSELRFFNLARAPENAIKYAQSRLDISDEIDLAVDRTRYEVDRRRDLELAGSHGIDEVMQANQLDALLFPGASGASIAARPGYPTVIVPFGRAPNAATPDFPGGFDARPAPFGVSFTGPSCSEPRLIELAYAFEQATKRRVPPPATP
ncbi:MAG TPA: amidase family protein [Vicinamibacteria bacterium]|nr:amidase family protein [Vicinamibacteria bacterium]